MVNAVKNETWEGLTDTQRNVVAWMVDNDKDHKEAVKEKMVAPATVYSVWTLARIEKWKELYRAHRQRQQSVLDRVDREMDSLAEEALGVMRDTLINREGNPTAVRAAQWVLDAVRATRAQKPAHLVPNSAPDSAELELAKVLKLVK